MQDNDKTKAQLLDELNDLRQKLAQVEVRRNSQATRAAEKTMGEQHIYKIGLDMLPQNVYQKDKNHRITYGNNAYLNTIGLSLQECLGKTNDDLFPPDLAAKYTADDNHVLETGETIDEIEPQRLPGSEHDTYVRAIKTPIRDADGNIVGTQGIFWDVTERVLAEQALRRSEIRSRALVNAMPDLIFTVRRDGTVLDVRGGLEADLYSTVEQIVGKNVLEILPSPLAEERMNYIEQAFQTGQIQRFEYEIVIDGETRHEEGRIAVIGEDEVLHIVRDITERKKIEQERRADESLLRTIIDATPDWIFIKDHEHRYQLVNRGYANSFNMKPEEFIGKNDLEIGFPEDIVKGNPDKEIVGFWPDDKKVMRSGKSKYIELEPAVVNNKQVWLRTRKIPLRNADGKVWGVLGFVHDITDLEENRRIVDKRATELETVAQVGTASATTLNVEELIQQVADLTKESFGLYHAHVYLLNEAGDTLNLAAGAGEVGRQMVAQGWSIPLAREQSLVARAARSRQGIIVNNVRDSSSWLPNPLLPDTYSELAVPMIVGNQVLGVLDVQSDVMNYFTEDDTRIQTTLAAQIAVALQNARQFDQQQKTSFLLAKRVKELNCLNEIGREIGEAPGMDELMEWVAKRIPPAMQYPDECMVAIEYKNKTYGNPQAINLPYHIVNALWAAKETVGRIYIAYTRKQELLDEESVMLGGIAARISSYLENQQLVAQTQERTAELERTTTFLNSIVDNIPSGLFVKDAQDLTFVEWNKTNEMIHGLKREDVLGKSDYDFFSPEEAEHFVTTDRKVLAGGELVDIPEEAVETPHQGVRVLHTRKIPILTSDGEPKYLLGISEDITEQKEAREALRSSEARTRALLNAIPDLIIRYNSQGVHLDIKEPIGFKTFRSPEELLGKTVHEVAPDELADKRMNYLQHALETDQLQVYEQQFETDTGTKYEEVRVVPSGNDEVFAVIRDITNQKMHQAEQQRLLAEVRRLAAIVENHPDFIGVGTMDGQALYVNPAGLRMMGLPVDHDVTQMDAGDFYLDADAEIMVKEGLPTALKEGSWTAETNLRHIDGRTIPVEETIGINYDSEGEPYSFSITMRDITERKQAEATLAEERNLLRTLIDNIPDHIYIKDTQSRFILVNDPVRRHLGAAALDEVIGKTDFDFSPPDLAKQYFEEEQMLFKSGQPLINHEQPIFDHETGTTRWVSSIKVLFTDDHGDVAGLIGLNRDITKQKEADAERERLLEEVQAAYRQYVRREWAQYLGDKHEGRWHIEYGQSGQQLETNGRNENDIAKIEAPIELRGEQIGMFNLEDLDPDRKWTSEELALVETISEQLAQTIENLRLFDNTQERATREQLTRQITDKMRAAPDVDTIIQTGLSELAGALGVSRTYVRLTTDLNTDE